MIKHKEHPVTCAMCGLTFTALGHHTQYCPECIKKRQEIQRVRYNAKRREDRAAEEDSLHFCDNQAQIQTCLGCTVPKCAYGTCPLVESLGRTHKGRPRISEETRKRAVALRGEGLTYKAISQTLGIGETTAFQIAKEAGAS